MKWNTIFGAMVLALGLSTQSFGFDMLDRMLGANGCGCDTTCCSTPAPACAAPALPTCGAEPLCSAEPTCQAEPVGACCKKKCCGLNLRGILSHRRCCKPVHCSAPACAEPNCAAPVAPTCGAEPSCAAEAPACCNNGCRKPCFLHRLFSCKHKCCKPVCSTACNAPTCGAEPSCGIGGFEGDKALPPMPPIPEIDQQ
jgi:hypothetical protein